MSQRMAEQNSCHVLCIPICSCCRHAAFSTIRFLHLTRQYFGELARCRSSARQITLDNQALRPPASSSLRSLHSGRSLHLLQHSLAGRLPLLESAGHILAVAYGGEVVLPNSYARQYLDVRHDGKYAFRRLPNPFEPRASLIDRQALHAALLLRSFRRNRGRRDHGVASQVARRGRSAISP